MFCLLDAISVLIRWFVVVSVSVLSNGVSLIDGGDARLLLFACWFLAFSSTSWIA